eukprot:11337840-Ditylum_brightwellii.AAC.1
MRTAPSTKQQSNPKLKQAVIVFTRPTPRQLEHGQFHMYRLCTTPAEANSPTYKLSIPFFDERAPEDLIKFQRGLQAVLKGQNMTQGPQVTQLQRPYLRVTC